MTLLHAVPYIMKRLSLKNTLGSVQSGMPGSNIETRGRFCEGLGSKIVVQYSVGPNITLHGRITAREHVDRLGNQVHLMTHTLFPNKDAAFQDDNDPIHTVGTVSSWFEEHEGELQHLPWPAESPDLNITEPLWSVLETNVRCRFPYPIPLKPNSVALVRKKTIPIERSPLVGEVSAKFCR
jgi:hypothetical protein